jgi:hypothetical protein
MCSIANLDSSFKQLLIGKINAFMKRADSLLDKSIICRSVNEDYSGVVLLGPDHPWGELDLETKRLQSEIYNEYMKLMEIGKSILYKSLPENRAKFDEASVLLFQIVEQSQYTWLKNIAEAKEKLKERVNTQIETINLAHGKMGDGILFLPDTNILISNPNLHDYKMKEKCNILFLPSILGELDKLKNEHSNENVRKKAQTAIRNIKEYRRRGSLIDGVKITVEPKFDGKPSWLDPNNQDDRFIASCFEIISMFPDSDAAILTLDINLQNKAEYSLIPYIDPQEAGILN